MFSAEIVNIPYHEENDKTPEKEVYSFTINPDEEIAPPAAALESIEDGSVLGTTKIVDHGNEDDCWNIAIFAEGYHADELEKFKTDAENFINYMSEFTPFNDFWHRVNVFRVDVESDESGADLPANCGGGTPAHVRTYFNATYCGSHGIQRLLVVDTSICKESMARACPKGACSLSHCKQRSVRRFGERIIFRYSLLTPYLRILESTSSGTVSLTLRMNTREMN